MGERARHYVPIKDRIPEELAPYMGEAAPLRDNLPAILQVDENSDQEQEDYTGNFRKN